MSARDSFVGIGRFLSTRIPACQRSHSDIHCSNFIPWFSFLTDLTASSVQRLLWCHQQQLAIVGVCLGLYVGGFRVNAECITVMWDDASGSEVQGYAVYYGRLGATDTNRVFVGNAKSLDLCGFQYGEIYWFQAASVDPEGIESRPTERLLYGSSPPVPLHSVATIRGPAQSATPVGFEPEVRIDDCYKLVHIAVDVSEDQKVAFETSTDLRTWRKMGVYSSAVGFVEVAEVATDAPWRFYRAIVAPTPHLPPYPSLLPEPEPLPASSSASSSKVTAPE